MRGDQHPGDDRLLARYFGASGSDSIVEQHLFACGACADRQRALVALLDSDRETWQQRSEAWLSPARLDRQLHSILDRIAEPPRGGRVLRFPSLSAAAAPAASPGRPYRRRVVAAAAVLAMLGAGTAGFVIREGRTPLPGTAPTPSWTSAPHAVPGAHGEEALLSEIELALGSSRAPELAVLDALTPHGPDSGDR